MNKIYIFIISTVFCLNNISASTFTSIASGGWNDKLLVWSVTGGADSDNIPDATDDVIISAAHTVSLTVAINRFKTLLVQATGILNANGKNLYAYGNITINGSFINPVYLNTYANCTLTSALTLTNTLTWGVKSGTLTIPAATTISKPTSYINISNGTSLINNGVVSAGVILNTSGNWTNGSGSSLTTNYNITGTGTLNASAVSNTVTYNAVGVKQIKTATSYYNLVINAASTKSVTANLIVLNNLTLGATATNTLNMNNFNLTIGGNWINNANTNVTNQATTTFNGANQTISRAGANNELFNNLVIGPTGTTTLAKAITVSRNLTVSSGTLDLTASNFSVNVGGNLTNNSSINYRSALLTLNGAALQTISGTSANSFYDVTLNGAGGAIINTASTISDALTVTNGNFNSNGNITLLSTALTTARLGVVGAGGSFSNNMTIQQFINTRTKGWHDLSSPAQSTTINDWDNEIYMSGIGAYDGVVGPAGVDGNAFNFKSVTSYRESTASWVQMSGSATPFVSGVGYQIWLADNQSQWFAKIIDTRGVPSFGTKVINLSYTAGAGAYAGVNLVGNPFAASISYSLVTKTNAPGSILILDNTGNYTDYGTSAIIPPHQGFWVTATGAGASISIPESAKTANTTTQFYKQIPNYGIKLVFSSPTLPYYNENTINFNSKSGKGFDVLTDAPYLKSPNEDAPAVYMNVSENEKLITNAVNSDEDELVIPLSLYTPSEGIYYIQPSVLSIDLYNYVWIENTKTGEKFDLDRSIAVEGKNDNTNTDLVLHLSKVAKSAVVTQSLFENDLVVFNTDNNVNIKANNVDHMITHVSIYNLSGQLVLETSNIALEKGNTEKIDISSLAPGMYIVNVIDNTNHSVTKKIIR